MITYFEFVQTVALPRGFGVQSVSKSIDQPASSRFRRDSGSNLYLHPTYRHFWKRTGCHQWGFLLGVNRVFNNPFRRYPQEVAIQPFEP